MSRDKNAVNAMVKAHLDNLFSDVGPTQQLFDLKEELTTNMKEKIADFQSRGMEGSQAFKEAVISMGDLGGLVDDMRQLGRDSARQAVHTSMATRLSIAGLVSGVLLVLFGAFTVAMLYFMELSWMNAWGPGVFVVAGGALITYSALTLEARKKYAMNRVRAALYGLSLGSVLFGIFAAIMSGLTTGETYIAIAAMMVFTLVGTGLFLLLILTGVDRRKP